MSVVFRTSSLRPRGTGASTLRLRMDGSRRFEVQFHTRESYAAAKATRGLYEEFRLATTPAHRRAELAAEIGAAFASVQVPPGALP